MAETALVVLFPELEPLLGDVRRRYTTDGARGMPSHVTLIYPFADSDDIDARLTAIGAELSPFAPFDARFERPARWPDTLYLEPEPHERFVAMTEALVRAFPEFPPYGGRFGGIVPHVTVAHGDSALFDELERDLVPSLGLTVRVERVWLMCDTPAGWRRHTQFLLDRRKPV
jgi:2'-5' RNA ligase